MGQELDAIFGRRNARTLNNLATGIAGAHDSRSFVNQEYAEQGRDRGNDLDAKEAERWLKILQKEESQGQSRMQLFPVGNDSFRVRIDGVGHDSKPVRLSPEAMEMLAPYIVKTEGRPQSMAPQTPPQAAPAAYSVNLPYLQNEAALQQSGEAAVPVMRPAVLYQPAPQQALHTTPSPMDPPTPQNAILTQIMATGLPPRAAETAPEVPLPVAPQQNPHAAPQQSVPGPAPVAASASLFDEIIQQVSPMPATAPIPPAPAVDAPPPSASMFTQIMANIDAVPAHAAAPAPAQATHYSTSVDQQPLVEMGKQITGAAAGSDVAKAVERTLLGQSNGDGRLDDKEMLAALNRLQGNGQLAMLQEAIAGLRSAGVSGGQQADAPARVTIADARTQEQREAASAGVTV